MKKFLDLLKKQFHTYWPLLVICGGYVLISLIWIEHYTNCLFKMTTGLPCPGCGLTRAFLALLRFDLAASFFFNPLWPLVIIIGLVIFFGPTKLGGKFLNSKIFWTVVFILVITIYIYRMLTVFPSEPLTYEPRNLINFLKELLFD